MNSSTSSPTSVGLFFRPDFLSVREFPNTFDSRFPRSVTPRPASRHAPKHPTSHAPKLVRELPNRSDSRSPRSVTPRLAYCLNVWFLFCLNVWKSFTVMSDFFNIKIIQTREIGVLNVWFFGHLSGKCLVNVWKKPDIIKSKHRGLSAVNGLQFLSDLSYLTVLSSIKSSIFYNVWFFQKIGINYKRL